jgi:hypothetical protein
MSATTRMPRLAAMSEKLHKLEDALALVNADMDALVDTFDENEKAEFARLLGYEPGGDDA